MPGDTRYVRRLLVLCTLAAAGCDAVFRLDELQPPADAFTYVWTPSNDVTVDLVDSVTAPIAFNGTVVLDTDSGAITGAFDRPAGTGVAAGIRFETLPGAPAVGVFVFSDLQVSGIVHFTGT